MLVTLHFFSYIALSCYSWAHNGILLSSFASLQKRGVADEELVALDLLITGDKCSFRKIYSSTRSVQTQLDKFRLQCKHEI